MMPPDVAPDSVKTSVTMTPSATTMPPASATRSVSAIKMPSDGDDPITFQKAKKLLEAACQKAKLNEEHIILIQESTGLCTAKCLPCNQVIVLGKFKRGLSNIHQHVGNKVHVMSVKRWNDRKLNRNIHNHDDQGPTKKQKLDEEKRQIDQKMQDVFSVIEECHGKNTFQLLIGSHEILCSFCLDSKFKIFPDRGDVHKNIKAHADSVSHKLKQTYDKPQKMISSFFKRQ